MNSNSGDILGIDYGTRRIGLAIGRREQRMAMPLDAIAARNDPQADAAAVVSFAADYDVCLFVVGLPLNMDGSEGAQARLSRAFGVALERASGLPVSYQDERLSSFGADQLTQSAGLSRAEGRRHRDKLAAQIVLQAYLDSA